MRYTGLTGEGRWITLVVEGKRVHADSRTVQTSGTVQTGDILCMGKRTWAGQTHRQ